MNIYYNTIPAQHILNKMDFQIPEAMIIQTVDIYEEALPYIECKMRNTIRHEAAHRDDEFATEGSDMAWEERSSEGRVEPIAEKAETEECDAVRPAEVGNVISVNVDSVLQKAKNASGIDDSFLGDVKGVILSDDVLGMYPFQSVPQQFTGWDGSIYINVARFFKDWIVKDPNRALPPTIQDDGIEPDSDLSGVPGWSGMSNTPTPNEAPSQSIPAKQPVPSIGAR